MTYQAIPPVAGADAWYTNAVSSMRGLVPQLTRFEYIKVGTKPNVAIDGTVSIDAGIVGGGFGVVSDTVYQKYTPTVYQTPRTDPMGLMYRCKFPAIAASKTSLVGAATVANVLGVTFGWNHVSSPTKWTLVTSAGGGEVTISTTNADTSWHNVMLTVNPTASLVIAQVDGVEMARSVNVATLTNNACALASFSSATLTPGVLVSRIAYGYVDP